MALTLIECDACEEIIINGKCECTETRTRTDIRRNRDNRRAMRHDEGFAPRSDKSRAMAARAYKRLHNINL